MKKFLIRTSLFCLAAIVICTCYLALFGLRYGNQFDAYYQRLTQYHPEGLIIGTSRAAQALEPEFISSNIYNFSFTIAHASYDMSYFNFIKKYHPITNSSPDKKLIHILAVDPWSVRTSHEKMDEIYNHGSFTEELLLPPMNPNLEYLARFGGKALYFDFKNYGQINKNGRLEVTPSGKETPEGFQKKLAQKLESYREKSEFKNGYTSEKRLQVLRDLIQYLQQDGEVYLVRIPVHPEMLALENQICPEFNSVIQRVASEMKTPYFMLTDFSYETTDGNHIKNKESKRISEQIRDSIKVYSNIIE
jgi:hypothetical protein